MSEGKWGSRHVSSDKYDKFVLVLYFRLPCYSLENQPNFPLTRLRSKSDHPSEIEITYRGPHFVSQEHVE
jgi:hypothetical protein